MVMQFIQHPAGIIQTPNLGVMQLTVPRLTKLEASSLQLSKKAVPLEQYIGPSKQNPHPFDPKAAAGEEVPTTRHGMVVLSSPKRETN